jgi:glyoxylase-like metal-dependent hydrolase (beta-lactamase superfamily II)
LLIDLGDGTALDHLGQIGVKRVEWILFTQHHREQTQGAHRLAPWRARGTKVAVPEAERALFERPMDFRKMNVRLGDAYTIHGSSYVRPPIEPVPVDRTFRAMDTFEWRGLEFWCLDTRGNSPGAMSYLLKVDDHWLAFSGDVALAGATMHTWFDTEWDYGFGAGIHALHNAAALVADFDPAWLMPSQGLPIPAPSATLREFQAKLRRLERLYLRGYDVHTFSSAHQDRVSTPTVVPHVWQVSPHLFKFKGPNLFPNFVLILADSGRALVVDCGLLDEKELDRALDGMRDQLGLKAIDAVVVTHMHGDHFLEAPHLRTNWGAQIWALDRMAATCEFPERFDYAAPIQAYAKPGVERVRFDRLFRSGETFEWEGYMFTVDWMPGQTEFALCLHGEIDGLKVAFTGDNIFADPDDPTHTGHEAVVAHNSAILEEGYIYAAEYLKQLQPDLILGGHSFVMNKPAALIERYRAWAYDLREAFQALSPDPDYRYWFDPFWVRAEPYRVLLNRGETSEIQVHVHNFRDREQTHRIEIRAPPGITVEPDLLEGRLPARSRRSFPVRITAGKEAPGGVRSLGLDVTLDGQRYGQRFDLITATQ